MPVRKQVDQAADLSPLRRSHATAAKDTAPSHTDLTAATSKVADGSERVNDFDTAGSGI
jgi:hypothetical protein